MPDNTNVNANSAVVVVGRTAPVPPGQQKSEKSIPVVIANDQSTIPVAEQNKVQSEVALSLLGIPRSEVALGIFADVNTYDVNPTEWSANPEQFASVPIVSEELSDVTRKTTGPYEGVEGDMGHGLTHVPEESGALIEAPADKTAVLTSKRFFRYQPGRVSAATFGVKTSLVNDNGASTSNQYPLSANHGGWKNNVNGTDVSNTIVANPSIRKYGIFDKLDGYYWETRNNGEGDNFCVVRRTQSLPYKNPLEFGGGGLSNDPPQQSEDYGFTNPPDSLAARASEATNITANNNAGVNVAAGSTALPVGFTTNINFGDLCIVRDNLMMTHAGAYDPSLLQNEKKVIIDSVTHGDSNPTFEFGLDSGISVGIKTATYDIASGIMVVTTQKDHGWERGKFIQIVGMALTCDTGDHKGKAKIYSNNTHGFNILEVPSTTSFKLNVGVSTVPSYYPSITNNANNGLANGWAVGLSTGQYVRYAEAGGPVGFITGMKDTQIYKVRNIGINTMTGITTCTLNTFSATANAASTSPDGISVGKGEVSLNTVGVGAGAAGGYTRDTTSNLTHTLVTPVPFVHPIHYGQIDPSSSQSSALYGKNDIQTGTATTMSEGTGMFPYMYKAVKSGANVKEGFIDTTLTNSSTDVATLRAQIDLVNSYYKKWINQNVAMDYWNVYEYRVPRSRFSGDRLDGTTDTLLYSDVVSANRAGDIVKDADTGENATDVSIWNLDFTKVTMYKIEFSWYGAVGALFLAYVPVSSGEARWVRVHHLRCSNQLKMSSLGNATLPITYMVYGGGGEDCFGYKNSKRTQSTFGYATPSEHIIKYGASYYIDGGDRGTVKLFSHSTDDNIDVFGSKRTMTIDSAINVGAGKSIKVDSNATNSENPYIEVDPTSGLGTSYYMGAKVITGNALDQNISISYMDLVSNPRKLFLNVPLNSSVLSVMNNNITIIPDRPTPLVGLKCKDFVTSSTGRKVRNRTQVYPTRMSSGSTGLVKIDFLKTPIFQTDTIVTSASPPSLKSSFETGEHSGNWNIGKRGKPTKVDIDLVSYTGSHTYNGGNVTGNITSDNGSTLFNTTSSNTSYNSANGRLTIGLASGHGLTTSSKVRIKKSTLSFTCGLDSNATTHTYPRDIDPMRDDNDASINEGYLSVETAGNGGASYDPTSGVMTIKTTTNHGFTANSSKIRFKANSLTFTCAKDGNVSQKTYPRASGEAGSVNEGIADPGYSQWFTVATTPTNNTFTVQVLPSAPSTNTSAHVYIGADANCIIKPRWTTGDWSKQLDVVATSASSITVRVNSSDTDTASAAEYIRDIGKGVYGWFRGYYKSDVTKKPFAVLGYLENRGSDRTKNVTSDGYYFNAVESTSDDIMIFGGTGSLPFIYEQNSSPKDGVGVSGANVDFEKEGLSSVKISPQTRSPMPGSGTVVASIFAPASGQEYDLAPYFDYNKEYLSFPLTDKVESLYLCASSANAFSDATAQAAISASLTWEEQ